MASAEWARDAAAVWDIATPARPGRLPGVTMAGFRQRTAGDIDLRVVPYPAVTVAVDLGEGRAVIDDASGGRHRGSVVIGMGPAGVRVRGRGIEGLQLRLSPPVALAVLGASDGGGEVIALDDLWGHDAARVEERLRAAASWDERFALAEEALARRLEAHRPADPEVAHAWDRLEATGGRARIDDVAAEVGWSRKRLWSRFRDQVGLGPKRAARLVRFDHAAHRLAGGLAPALAAAESGYADQSHLHRDALTVAGLSPRALAVAAWLAVDDVAWPGTAVRSLRP